MVREYYRYTEDQQEIRQLSDDRKIESTVSSTNQTWYSPNRYPDSSKAENKLALSITPDYRLGPVSQIKMPTFNKIVQRVPTRNGKPGGGVEIAVTDPVWLFGLWNFQNKDWEEY